MNSSSSPYYPRRAHWYSRLWYPWEAVKRSFRLDRIEQWIELPLHQLVLAAIVPGCAPWLYGRKGLSVVLMASYTFLAIVYVVWIGHTAANLALGGLISIHSSGIVFLLERAEPDMQLGKRTLWGLLAFVIVWGTIYRPILRQLEARWFVPLRIGERVVVVKTGVRPEQIRRGDEVAYRLLARNTTSVRMREGLTFGRVMAVGGDQVMFRPDSVLVGNERHPRRERMPSDGTVIVPENHWYIWPQVNIGNYGNISAETIARALSESAIVAQADLVGKPYRRWFWREQTIP